MSRIELGNGRSKSWFAIKLVKENWELLSMVLVFLLLLIMSPAVGGSYLVFEVLWDFTMLMAIASYMGVNPLSYLGQTWKRADSFVDFFDLVFKTIKEFQQTKVIGDKDAAWRWFQLNRTIAFVQPVFGLWVAIYWIGIPFEDGWYGYLYMVGDLLHTIWSVRVVKKAFFPERGSYVRRALPEDIDALVEIDRLAFPDPAQQALPAELRQRLATTDTNLVLIDGESESIVGCLYTRCVKLECIVAAQDLKWSDLANQGDFRPVPNADMLYVVGIAARSQGDNVAGRLEAAGIRLVVDLSLRYGGGGPRIPGFAGSRYQLHQLDEYVLATNRKGFPIDPLLGLFVRRTVVPFLGPLARPVRGIRDYFPDPESRDCAALVVFEDPLRRIEFGNWLLNNSFLVRNVWGRILEMMMLHL